MKKKLYIQPDLEIYHFPHQPLLAEISSNTDGITEEEEEVPAPPLGPADIPTDGWNE